MQNVSEFSTPTPTNLNWLNIGQSFVLPPPETHTRKNIPNYLGEDLIEQSKKFFNVDKRKSAADYIDDQFSCSSEEKKLKSMKKKIKKARLKTTKKKIKSPFKASKPLHNHRKPAKSHENRVLPVPEPLLDISQMDFLYKHILKPNVFPITIMRFGIEDNYKYGLKINDVPKFRRVKNNVILGLKSDNITQDILNELNEIQGVLKPETHVKRLRFFELNDHLECEALQKSFKSSHMHSDDYISFQQTQIEQKEENPLIFSLNRSLISAKEDEFLQETKRFNELLGKNPNNVEIWLDFINFQKKMFFYLPNSNKNNQNITEKQLSIVEKALENQFLKDNPLLNLMKIKLLKNANKGEDFFKVCEGAWKENLEREPENSLFWTLFFDFKFSNFIKFNASYFREESETILKKEISGSIMALLIKNICFIEKEMGYIERSYGIFQALIEYTFFNPKSPFPKSKLLSFQDFWERKSCIKTGEIDLFNGWEDSLDNTKEIAIKEEFQRSFLGKYEEIFREINEKPIENNLWVEEELRNSLEWRPKKAFWENSNIESVVLFEDIELFLKIFEKKEDVSGEILNNYLHFMGFPPLTRDFFIRIEDNCISEFYYSKILTKLQEINDKTKKPTTNEDSYLNINKLDFFLKFWGLNDRDYLVGGFEELKIEYIRRIMHQIYRKWPMNEVLYYIFFLEGLFYLNPKENSLVFTLEKAKKARNSFKMLLKNNESNAGLWVIYTEVEFLKNKNVFEAKKIFETVLRVIDAKNKAIVTYYYSSFFIRTYNEFKCFTKDFADSIILENLKNGLLLLDSNPSPSALNYENKAFLLKIAAKKFENEFSSRLKRDKQRKKQRKPKILSKRALILYFLMLSLSYSNFQEFCEILNKIELLRLFYQKNSHYYSDIISNDNEIQLLYVNFSRLFAFQIRYDSNEDKQKFLGILSLFLRNYPNNALFINEIINKSDKNTMRINKIPKLKELLNCKFIPLSIWMLYLYKEILNGKEWEFPLFLKRILVIFNEITKEENCPLERAISRLEFNNKEEVMPENLSSNLAKIFKLYQEFSGMVDFKENAKINLYSLHRIPFSKELYLKHLKNTMRNQEPIKEVLMLILSKEFRFYREPNFF